jgi:hypothetical protein
MWFTTSEGMMPGLRLCVSMMMALMALMALLTSGCTLNSTVPLATGGAPGAGRAVVVYGVSVEGRWPYEHYAVQLTEYSMAKQAITGNCFRFNRVDATVPATMSGIRYFAFEVAPGSYVYSPMNGAQLKGDPVAFGVPAAHAVYIGDFIYGKDGRVTRTGNLDAERAAIRAALPAVPDDLMPAETVPVAAPKPFLCTP